MHSFFNCNAGGVQTPRPVVDGPGHRARRPRGRRAGPAGDHHHGLDAGVVRAGAAEVLEERLDDLGAQRGADGGQPARLGAAGRTWAGGLGGGARLRAALVVPDRSLGRNATFRAFNVQKRVGFKLNVVNVIQ